MPYGEDSSEALTDQGCILRRVRDDYRIGIIVDVKAEGDKAQTEQWRDYTLHEEIGDRKFKAGMLLLLVG